MHIWSTYHVIVREPVSYVTYNVFNYIRIAFLSDFWKCEINNTEFFECLPLVDRPIAPLA